LHASQHAATREELDGVRRDLKADILKVESGLKADILKVESSISKIDSKFDRLQWLIVGVIISVFLKDSIIALFSSAPAP
jgi:hypothetical protein